MKFTLTIDSDDANLDEGGREELAEVLRREVDMVANPYMGDHRVIRDGNGNIIGQWTWWTYVKESKEDGG